MSMQLLQFLRWGVFILQIICTYIEDVQVVRILTFMNFSTKYRLLNFFVIFGWILLTGYMICPLNSSYSFKPREFLYCRMQIICTYIEDVHVVRILTFMIFCTKYRLLNLVIFGWIFKFADHSSYIKDLHVVRIFVAINFCNNTYIAGASYVSYRHNYQY